MKFRTLVAEAIFMAILFPMVTFAQEQDKEEIERIRQLIKGLKSSDPNFSFFLIGEQYRTLKIIDDTKGQLETTIFSP